MLIHDNHANNTVRNTMTKNNHFNFHLPGPRSTSQVSQARREHKSMAISQIFCDASAPWPKRELLIATVIGCFHWWWWLQLSSAEPMRFRYIILHTYETKLPKILSWRREWWKLFCEEIPGPGLDSLIHLMQHPIQRWCLRRGMSNNCCVLSQPLVAAERWHKIHQDSKLATLQLISTKFNSNFARK